MNVLPLEMLNLNSIISNIYPINLFINPCEVNNKIRSFDFNNQSPNIKGKI